MTSSNTDINNICNQFRINKEDEIIFNKLRDEIASLGQQIITLNETRFNAINKMQELLDKYTVDEKIVNNFIDNFEKYPSTTIINDKHTSKTAPKAVIDESELVEESKPKKTVKKKPVAPKKSGAAATKIEDEELETNEELTQETQESETNKEHEQETQIGGSEETYEPEEDKQSKPIKKTAVKKTTTAKKAPVKKTTAAKKTQVKKTL